MSCLFDLGQSKGDGGRVAVRRQRIDPRTARVAQAQQLGDFVESLAGRIVEGGANVLVSKALALVPGEIEVGVTAGNDQGQRSAIAQVERFAVRQQNGVNVTLQVVDGDERLFTGEGTWLS